MLYLQEEKYDIQKAVNYFEKSADKNHWASYQLGRIYLFGAKDIERDKEQAIEWFTKSANDGNEYAQAILDEISKFENDLLANTIFSLFVSLSRCIQDSYDNDRKDLQSIVDRKLMRVIRRKKMELLGHSNVNITLNRYVHSSLDTKKKYVEKLNFVA